MDKYSHFQPIAGNLWVEVLSEDTLILTELKRLGLSSRLQKSKHNLTLLGKNKRLVLHHNFTQAIFIWNKVIVSPRKYGIECTLFVNNSQENTIDLLQEAMLLARICWVEYQFYVHLDHDAFPKNAEHVYGKCGWNPNGVDEKGLLIYTSDFGI